jgi:perosamine synthetase
MKTTLNIPLSRPDITGGDRALVLETLKTPHLSLGPRLKEFEEKFAAFLGVKHAVAVNSGTSALHLCVRALGIGEGDTVITSPFSFVASANCLLYERARPVFVDIDPVTLNIDVALVEEKVQELLGKGATGGGQGKAIGRGTSQKGRARTSKPAKGGILKALLPVHVFGRPCDMPAIMDIARRYELRVIEDSCEALGAELKTEVLGKHKKTGGRPLTAAPPSWRKAGTFGDCSAYGFYPNKQMTTGEGGIVATNDDAIAAMCRSMRNQGRGETAAWLQHERLGFNYRLSDINCALGVGQLSRLEDMIAKRARVAGWYEERMKGLKDVIVPQAGEGEHISWFVYVVRLGERFSRVDRDRVLASLREQGIGCANYFTPIHLQPFYRRMFGFKEGDYPVTESVAARTIALPFYNDLNERQVDFIVASLKDILVPST